MNIKIIKVFAISALSFLLFNCQDKPDFPVDSVQGYRPVYESTNLAAITFGAVRPIVKPGKILRYENYLLINELNDGIHFYDNTNPSLPI